MPMHVRFVRGTLLLALALAGCGEGAGDDAPALGVETSEASRGVDPRLGRLRLPRITLEAATADDEPARAAGEFRGGPREEQFERNGASPFAADRFGEAGDDCFARCAGDRACRLRCLDGLQEDERDCLECGRETGFLPRPDLWVAEGFDGKAVVLEWTPIDEATDYVVHGLKVPYRGGEGPEAMSWETQRSSLRAEVSAGFIYVFYVVAIDTPDGVRSKPSRTVTVRL